MKDVELYAIRHSDFSYMADAQAHAAIAHRYDLNSDSVRGRIYRVAKSNATEAAAALIKRLSHSVNDVDPSVRTQMAILDRAKKRWQKLQKADIGKSRIGVFVSDLHFPYTRQDALLLMLKIFDDIQPDYVSVANDAMDNSGKKHKDNRRARSLLWSQDEAYSERLESAYHAAINDSATLLQVQGNHDNWLYSYCRQSPNGEPAHDGEAKIAQRMVRLEEEGVIQFSRGFDEPAVWVAPRLVWWHGQFASKLSTTNARNTIQQYVKHGVASNVCVGHTHRPATIAGSTVGYNGVTFINSPCMCRLDGLPYLKRRPVGWQLGITIWRWQASGHVRDDYYRGDIVLFEERGKYLVARYEGTEYAVKMDRSMPDDYA